MTPLSYMEVTDFSLERIMISGLLPSHYLSPDPIEDLRSYVADYLKEEVISEALTQNIPAFNEFLMELKAYQAYRNPDWPISFWRTSTGREVDFILGDKELAMEIKGSARIHEGDIASLQALLEDGPVKKCCIVCLENQPRQLTKNIESIPWQLFLERLWSGEFD